jgi:hypothetical protein
MRKFDLGDVESRNGEKKQEARTLNREIVFTPNPGPMLNVAPLETESARASATTVKFI